MNTVFLDVQRVTRAPGMSPKIQCYESPAYESHRADRVLGHGLVPSNQSILLIGKPFHNCLPISVPLCPTL